MSIEMTELEIRYSNAFSRQLSKYYQQLADVVTASPKAKNVPQLQEIMKRMDVDIRSLESNVKMVQEKLASEMLAVQKQAAQKATTKAVDLEKKNTTSSKVTNTETCPVCRATYQRTGERTACPNIGRPGHSTVNMNRLVRPTCSNRWCHNKLAEMTFAQATARPVCDDCKNKEA